MQRSEIEIMAPVGSYEALAAAIQAGADSVYFGVGKLNMRSASAANFTLDDLAKIVATAHAAGVKAYLTVNTIVYEDEMQTVHEVIDRAKASTPSSPPISRRYSMPGASGSKCIFRPRATFRIPKP